MPSRAEEHALLLLDRVRHATASKQDSNPKLSVLTFLILC